MLTRLLFATLLVAASTFRSRAEDADPLEVAIGERLFLETRFAQFFAANSGVDANATLAVGDPVMDTTKTIESPQPGPFAGQSMNRRACHLVDEHNAALGNRTYADFARRSPVPDRGDGHTTTPRNSPSLVNASLRRPGGMRLHFDGEFASGRELAIGTFTGRNFGWLPAERLPAIAHIGRIIRDDDGTGALARGIRRRVSHGLERNRPEPPRKTSAATCLPHRRDEIHRSGNPANYRQPRPSLPRLAAIRADALRHLRRLAIRSLPLKK